MLNAYEAHHIRVEGAIAERVDRALEELDWYVRDAALNGRGWVRYESTAPELLYRVAEKLRVLHYDVQHEHGAIVIRW